MISSSNYNIPYALPYFDSKEIEYVEDALKSTWVSGGKYVDKLEEKLGEIFGVSKVLATSNGTTAIHLAYLGIGIQPEDEIIFPSWGFMGGANVAIHLGAVPIFAGIDPETWLITAREIEKKITDKTKAIFVVHTYGNVCNMSEIMELAQKYNLHVIEDCAESLFSKQDSKLSGTFGNLGVFSMQATKTITTGEGGFVTCNDESFTRLMNLYRSHGLSKRGIYYHEVPGHNFRLTNIQAAVGVAQLEKFQEIIKERSRVYNTYKQSLENVEGISLQKVVVSTLPTMWTLGIKLDLKVFNKTNIQVIENLRGKGIETRPGFMSSTNLEIYPKHEEQVSLDLEQSVISLPIYPSLTDHEVDYICRSLLEERSK